jgi:hypothetical protein
MLVRVALNLANFFDYRLQFVASLLDLGSFF